MSRAFPSAAACGWAIASSALIALPAPARTVSAGVTVERAWVRPAPAGLPASAAYFTVRNTGRTADVLEGVSTPGAAASLHESMEHGGMMTMQPLGPLAVPSGGVVEFKPGGLHVMLERLTRPLKPGDRLPLILTFKRAGKVTVTAEVRRSAP